MTSEAVEIFERNIEMIELERGDNVTTYRARPFDGTAKWFKDELGQCWVKFRTQSLQIGGGTQTQVWAARRVVQVVYSPRSAEISTEFVESGESNP